jgi:chromosome partitioning protein
LQVVEQVQKYFGSKVYKTTIPRSIRISEAPSYGQPINFYEPKGKGSEAYTDLAIEFIKNNRIANLAEKRKKAQAEEKKQADV